MVEKITSRENSLVKHLVRLRLDGEYRRESKTFLLEGVKVIRENPASVVKLFYTPSYAARAAVICKEKWEITEDVLHKISGMKSPEGMLAEVKMPSFASLSTETRVLAFDGLSDPGNVGTLMRTALGLGWDAVYFLPGCLDPFNEKVVRAARGAHFRLLLSAGTQTELWRWVESYGAQAIVADLQGKRAEELTPAKTRLLIMGNEAHGPSAESKKNAISVSIPMTSEIESLSVSIAGGILLYLLQRNL